MSALPIFPGRFQPSIFGANELNYRVRDGNGWTLIAINTDSRNTLSRERKRYSNRTIHKMQVFFSYFFTFYVLHKNNLKIIVEKCIFTNEIQSKQGFPPCFILNIKNYGYDIPPDFITKWNWKHFQQCFQENYYCYP